MAERALRLVYVWEFPVRVFHWINVLCMVTLAATGLLIARPLALMSGAEAWQGYWFGTLRFIHFVAGYLLLFNLVFRVYWAVVGNRYARWWVFIPLSPRRWGEILRVARMYFWFDPWSKEPETGHNALQGLVYLCLMLLVLFQVFTGFAMYAAMSQAWVPKLFAWGVPLMGGDLVVRAWHHLVLWVFVVFFIFHLYMVFLCDRQDRVGLFSSIITGWKVAAKK